MSHCWGFFDPEAACDPSNVTLLGRHLLAGRVA
jgi:hypothetical protein